MSREKGSGPTYLFELPTITHADNHQVYGSKLKKDLAGAFLFDLPPNYNGQICSPADDFPDGSFSEPVSDALHTIPKYAFKDYPFPCAKDFPTQEASAVDPEVRQPAKGDRMTAIMDSCVKARAKRRAGREEDRMKTMSEVDSRPSLSNRNRLIRCVC
jgi:hypothetical protein